VERKRRSDNVQNGVELNGVEMELNGVEGGAKRVVV
jgi:hypothetical protein